MYEAFKKQINEKLSDDEALNYVYDKIEEAEIWVPYYEVEKRYRDKKAKFKKIPVEAMQKLPQPLHLLKIYPESYDYLDSDLKKEGFEVRQHRGKYYN